MADYQAETFLVSRLAPGTQIVECSRSFTRNVKRDDPQVIVIGAGSTGAATAHDLTLRGLRVTVVERGEVASGTTGRNHCLLHSGGRYCVTDRQSAIECIDENMILRKIMPDILELNDGLFVALTEADLAFKERFLEGCAACHIPARDVPVKHALAMEPFLNPGFSPRYRYLTVC